MNREGNIENRSNRGNSTTMEHARDMLIGAVDTVIQLAMNQVGTVVPNSPGPSSAPESSGSTVSASQCSTRNSSRATIGPAQLSHNRDSIRRSADMPTEEHRRLFGFHRDRAAHSFEPSKAVNQARGRSRSYKGKGRYVSTRRPGRSTWKKCCICLKNKYQTCKPTAEEKMELAKMGLGLAELTFDSNGDAEHIHAALTDQFPQLETCGGYSLLRLKDNSYDLVEIEYPAKGMTVPYLKDILNQAKLYIRPLQKSIEDLEEKSHQDDGMFYKEPHEFCLTCDTLLPLSQLTKHIAECCSTSNSIAKEVVEEEEPEPPTKRSCVSNPIPTTPGNLSNTSSPLTSSLTYRISNKEISDASDGSYCNSDSEWQELVRSSDSLEDVIKFHRAKVLTDDICRITIRRDKIFEDALVAIRNNDWDKKQMRVTFAGEAAVDYGGPRREFFSLLLKSIERNTSLLDGRHDRRVVRHNTTAIQENTFLAVGKMIALSILNGGPGPAFLAQCVVDYLFGGLSVVMPHVEDVPDIQIQNKIKQLCSSKSTQEFRELLDRQEFDFRFFCGVGEPAGSMTLEDKQRVVDALCLHYCILSSVTELEQLKQGLVVQKFNTLMEKYPDALRTAFQPVLQGITSSLIEQLYCNHTNLAPRGSEKWSKQQGILNAWICYLRRIEEQPDAVPSLQDVFEFLTGCNCIPPSGFDVEPCIMFDELETGLPVVSTCALNILFPDDFPTNPIEFKEKMDLAVLSSKEHFGQL